MATVIVLQHLLEIRVRNPQPETVEFTRRDVADLEGWSTEGCRAVACTSETGQFAMLYKGDHAWASWGVVRKPRGVLLWNCVTLRDIGVFPTMADALAATGNHHVYSQNVLHLAAAGGVHPAALRRQRVR